MADELSKKEGPQLDPRLKNFIDRAIVPILVKEYLAQSQELPVQQAEVDRKSATT